MSLIDAIPETIKEIGQTEARGRLASGQWGVALGDIGHSIAALPAELQAKRSSDLRATQQQMEIDKQKREAAASSALQQVWSNPDVFNPDGSFNGTTIAQHMANTPAAQHIPEVLESINRMALTKQQIAEGQQHIALNADTLETKGEDDLGRLAYSASRLPDPDSQAAVLTTGLAAGVKSGKVKADDANRLLAEVLGPDGNPIPEKVQPIIDSLVSNSKEATAMRNQDANSASLTESRKSSEAQRNAAAAKSTQDEADKSDTKAINNYAGQLSRANSAAEAQRIFQGIPAAYQSRLPDPSTYDKTYGTRALESAMIPTDVVKTRAEMANAAANTARAAAISDREDRLENPPPGAVNSQRAYSQWVTQYNKEQVEQRLRTPALPVKDPTDPTGLTVKMVKTLPEAVPPVSYEKWSVMSPQERSATLNNPHMRIDDAEFARRTGATPTVPAQSAEVPPAPVVTPATAPAGRTLTQAQLEATAKRLNISVEDAKKQAIAKQYTLAP